MVKKISKIFLFVLTWSTNVSDGQTDGQTDRQTLHDSKDRAYASHRAVKIDYSCNFLNYLAFYRTGYLCRREGLSVNSSVRPSRWFTVRAGLLQVETKMFQFRWRVCLLYGFYCIYLFPDVDLQIQELKSTIKNLELNFLDYKRKEEALESKLKQTKHMFESVRDERNILSKNMLRANVIYVILLLNTCFTRPSRSCIVLKSVNTFRYCVKKIPLFASITA